MISVFLFMVIALSHAFKFEPRPSKLNSKDCGLCVVNFATGLNKTLNRYYNYTVPFSRQKGRNDFLLFTIF